MGEVQEQSESDEDEAKPAAAKQETLFVRKTGDASLYTYYLKSIRKRTLVVFFVLMAFVSALESFPGLFRAFNPIAVKIVNLLTADVYVRIWVDVAPASTDFFVGYVMLGVAAILLNGLAPWYALREHWLIRLLTKCRVYFYRLLPESSENLHWALVDTLMR